MLSLSLSEKRDKRDSGDSGNGSDIPHKKSRQHNQSSVISGFGSCAASSATHKPEVVCLKQSTLTTTSSVEPPTKSQPHIKLDNKAVSKEIMNQFMKANENTPLPTVVRGDVSGGRPSKTSNIIKGVKGTARKTSNKNKLLRQEMDMVAEFSKAAATADKNTSLILYALSGDKALEQSQNTDNPGSRAIISSVSSQTPTTAKTIAASPIINTASALSSSITTSTTVTTAALVYNTPKLMTSLPLVSMMLSSSKASLAIPLVASTANTATSLATSTAKTPMPLVSSIAKITGTTSCAMTTAASLSSSTIVSSAASTTNTAASLASLTATTATSLMSSTSEDLLTTAVLPSEVGIASRLQFTTDNNDPISAMPTIKAPPTKPTATASTLTSYVCKSSSIAQTASAIHPPAIIAAQSLISSTGTPGHSFKNKFENNKQCTVSSAAKLVQSAIAKVPNTISTPTAPKTASITTPKASSKPDKCVGAELPSTDVHKVLKESVQEPLESNKSASAFESADLNDILSAAGFTDAKSPDNTVDSAQCKSTLQADGDERSFAGSKLTDDMPKWLKSSDLNSTPLEIDLSSRRVASTAGKYGIMFAPCFKADYLNSDNMTFIHSNQFVCVTKFLSCIKVCYLEPQIKCMRSFAHF